MSEQSDLAAVLRAAGHAPPPKRLAEALALWQAMTEAARRLAALNLSEPPA